MANLHRVHDTSRHLSDRLLRVLLIVTDLDIGGTPLQVYRLARGLDELGVDVVVSCLGPWGPVADKIRTHGIAVHALGATSAHDIGVFRRLRHLVREVRSDICHSFLMHANIATRLAGVFTPTKTVSTICTVEQEKRWHMVLELLTSPLADRIVCISQAVKDHCRHWRLPADRLTIIRPGIDVDSIVQAPAADPGTLGVSSTAAKICYLGRLDPVKRIDLILNALNVIRQGHPNLDWQFLVIGDGPERSTLTRLADELGIASRVKFLGFRDDVAGILKLCQVKVLASRQEGWGIAITEALAVGVVVVATNIGATTEQIRNGENGILVEPNNAESLAKGILTGLELANSRRARSVAMDVSTLDFRREAQEYLTLYRSIVSQ